MRPPAFGMSPETTTRTARPAEGRIPQLRCGKTLLRLSGRYSDAHAEGMRPELTSLSRRSNMLAAPAQCAGHPSALRFSFAPHGARTQAARSNKSSLYGDCSTLRTSGLVHIGLRQWLIQRVQSTTLSERQRSLSVLGPLGAAPSSADRKRKKTAGCLSVSEFPAVPLAVRDGRAPMQSIGARQGVFSFGYFRLDKQTKVTRTTVRNPNPKPIRAVTSEVTRPQTARPSTFNAYRHPSPSDTPLLHGSGERTTQRTELDRGRP